MSSHMTEANNETRAARKVREGLVVSNKMNKTAVIAVVERVKHKKYDKFVLRTKKLYAHDEANDVQVGDRVRVAPSHIDPTMALHDTAWLLMGEAVIDRWSIDLRGW